MYGRTLQRKKSCRKPISFKGFRVKGKSDLETSFEKQHEFAARLKAENGKSTRLTPRYAR